MQSFIGSISRSGVGSPLEQIFRQSGIDLIEPNHQHKVLYASPHRSQVFPPTPFVGRLREQDQDYVRLPSASNMVVRIKQLGGGTSPEQLWLVVQKALLQPFNSISQLEEAMFCYNQRIGKLHSLQAFGRNLSDEDSHYFFEQLLPNIVNLALRLPELIKTGIPFLKRGQTFSISLSQLQASSLLANAFLCTFPSRKSEQKYPDINFNRLFESEGHQVVQKIICILHYFQRVTTQIPVGVLTFTRHSRNDLPDWYQQEIPLSNTPFFITSEGTIEDQGKELLQVDFANKYIGGGVLGRGCVQEEIRFVICPELILSRLFTESLSDNEALVITGAERFSDYSGYASSFKFLSDHVDNTPFEEKNMRRKSYIVAIDALNFSDPDDQYFERNIRRELNKAYAGFLTRNTTPRAVASGNWGCGAFGGDPKLKALIQLMACTITNRPLFYCTFEDSKLKDELHQMYMFFIQNNISVKELYHHLKEYGSKKKSGENLFTFITRRYFEKKNSISFADDNAKKSKNHESSNTKYESEKTSSNSTIVPIHNACKTTQNNTNRPHYQTSCAEIGEEAINYRKDWGHQRNNEDPYVTTNMLMNYWKEREMENQRSNSNSDSKQEKIKQTKTASFDSLDTKFSETTNIETENLHHNSKTYEKSFENGKRKPDSDNFLNKPNKLAAQSNCEKQSGSNLYPNLIIFYDNPDVQSTMEMERNKPSYSEVVKKKPVLKQTTMTNYCNPQK